MEIIFVEENRKLFGSTKALGIGKRQPKLIYGEQAKKLRESANLSIDDLAKEFRMKPFDIERIEEQKAQLTEKIYEKYRDKFNVKKQYFFDLDLETLILTAEGHVIASYETGEECLKEYEELLKEYQNYLKINKPLVIDFSERKGNK